MAQILLDAKNNIPNFKFPAGSIYCTDGKDVETKISSILSTNTNLTNRVSTLETKSVTLENSINKNKNSIDAINTKITNINTNISNIKNQNNSTGTQISTINNSIAAINKEISTIKAERIKIVSKSFTLNTTGWTTSPLSPYTFKYRISDTVFKANMISPIEFQLQKPGLSGNTVEEQIIEHSKIVRMNTQNGYCDIYTLGEEKPNKTLYIQFLIFTVT